VVYYLTYDIWYVHYLTFWLQCEMGMAIIVANGPALKVFYDSLRKKSQNQSEKQPRSWTLRWPEKWPRLRIVWNGSKSQPRSSWSRAERRWIPDKAPKISTVQVSEFKITQMMSQTNTVSTLRGSEEEYERYGDDWSDVLDKRQRAYYGV
jgi:hypothetical protein